MDTAPSPTPVVPNTAKPIIVMVDSRTYTRYIEEDCQDSLDERPDVASLTFNIVVLPDKRVATIRCRREKDGIAITVRVRGEKP